MSSIDTLFNELVDAFKSNLDKLEITERILEFCRESSPEEVYELKRKLDIQFSPEVGCSYNPGLFVTDTDYGCDLREIIYNRDHTLNSGESQTLLDIFREKQLQDKSYHILTDIDDTLFAHEAAGIAGSDVSWGKKKPYPGIITFYERFYGKLDEPKRYSTILSATPGCIKSARLSDPTMKSILKEYSFIQGKIESKMDMIGAIPGSIQNFCRWADRKAFGQEIPPDVFINVYKHFGDVKYQRYTEYKSIFPEYKFLFIGDNGQGDVIAGKQILENCPECKVFIHQVVENGREHKAPEINMDGLYYFKNYHELAKLFQELGIFDEDDVDAVANSAATEINKDENSKFKKFFTGLPGIMGGNLRTRKFRTKKRALKFKHKKRKSYRKRG